MAVSKGLREFLDKDTKGQYKKTRKNISRVLFYYGYTADDIQEIFDVNADYYSRFLDDKMEKRDLITSISYFTEEEKDLVKEFESKVEEVYKNNTGSKKKGVTKSKETKKKSKVRPVRRVKVNEEDIQEGISEEDIGSKSLLNRLRTISVKEEDKESTSRTRSKIEDNRKQEPIQSEAPEDGKCDRCEGLGWVMEKQEDGKVSRVKCPICLGKKVHVNKNEYEIKGKPLLEELIQNRHYLEETFSLQKLLEDNEVAYQNTTRQFDKYLEFLGDILTDVKTGNLPVKSYYIATPDGYGKKHFIYQVMKESVKFGYKPTQLLNGGLLHDLYRQGNFEELNELLEGDIIFVSITSLSRTRGLGNILTHIAETAENRGVPVIIIGRANVSLLLNDKDYNIPLLLSNYTRNGDYGHFQCEGFFGNDFNTLVGLQRERMSGALR